MARRGEQDSKTGLPGCARRASTRAIVPCARSASLHDVILVCAVSVCTVRNGGRVSTWSIVGVGQRGVRSWGTCEACCCGVTVLCCKNADGATGLGVENGCVSSGRAIADETSVRQLWPWHDALRVRACSVGIQSCAGRDGQAGRGARS